MHVPEKGFLPRFRSTHKLGQETAAEVIPFMLSVSLRGVESTACYVEQAGPLSSPILLDVQGGELQELIDKWNMQSAIHALDRHSGIVSLQ